MTDAPTTCYRHPDRTTRLACSNCGRPICAECMRDAAVGQRCPECAGGEHATRVVDARRARRVSMATAPVTVSLIVVNLVIYVASQASIDAERWLVENLALIKLIASDEWWRTVTAAFLHGSLLHVGVNMYILYLLGPQMERQTGSATFAALYVAAAAAGGAVSVLTGPALQNGFPVISVGASGAIFGLIGAWFSASYRHRHTPAGQAMFNQMLVWVGISAVFPFILGNIDWRAHVGGFLAGVLIHQVWARISPEREDARSVRLSACLVVAAAALAAVALL